MQEQQKTEIEQRKKKMEQQKTEIEQRKKKIEIDPPLIKA